MDLKILSAWVGHPKVFIIDNSTDFDGKMNRVVTSICRLLGVPRPKQIDRKFLVSAYQFPSGERFDFTACCPLAEIVLDLLYAVHYTETIYLRSEAREGVDRGFCFLRSRGDQKDSAQTYFFSTKYIFPGGESAVVERRECLVVVVVFGVSQFLQRFRGWSFKCCSRRLTRADIRCARKVRGSFSSFTHF